MHHDPTTRPSDLREHRGTQIGISTVRPTPVLAIVDVDGELDLTTVPQLDACLDHQLRRPGTTGLIIDLTRLRFLAVSGVRSLLRVDRDARARDVAVEVVVPRRIDRVLAVLELDRHLRVHPDLDSARRSLARRR